MRAFWVLPTVVSALTEAAFWLVTCAAKDEVSAVKRLSPVRPASVLQAELSPPRKSQKYSQWALSAPSSALR